MTLFKSEIEVRDPAYENIRDGDHPLEVRARDLCNALWVVFEPYSDSHFLDEIAKSFDERFWEMDLSCALITAGYNVECPKPGPDICLRDNEKKIWIEAICPGNGAGKDRVPDRQTGAVQAIPDEQIILRLTSSIAEKHTKYLAYVRDGIVGPDEPYVIAVNACQITCARLDFEPPRIVRTLFPIGAEYLTIDRETGELIKNEFVFKREIKKVNGTGIPIDIFLDPQLEGVSAVLFSVTDCCNRPNNIGDDFVLVHNPLAKNPINEGFLKFGREFIAEEHGETERRLRWNNYF